MNKIILNTIGTPCKAGGGGNSGGGGNGGGGNAPSAPSGGAVNFRDYDGTILHSYTKDAFLALAEMPTLPTRQGLTCQGWNYNIEDAKAYVSEYGVLEIGATYITDDGKTRLYITIAAEGRMDVPLYFQQTLANGVTIDWGDGSATQTLSGTGSKNTTHHYDTIGDYVISLEVADGCTLALGYNSSSYCVMGSIGENNKVYCNMLQRIEIGNGVTSIGGYVIQRCPSLASIVIPNGVTSIGYYTFQNCYSLTSVVIPQSVTSIGDATFYGCTSLASIVIPQNVTSIKSDAFNNCQSLTSVVIPNGVTIIEGYLFNNCYSLASVVIPNGVTRIGSSAFGYCYSLASVVIPNEMTSIGNYAFRDCQSLASIMIPQGVTSIETSAFQNCQALASIVIPQGVTSIIGDTFKSCSGMAFYDFSTHSSVPTLANTNAFSSIPSSCKIVVPDSLYDEWIAATNWSTYASKIVKASEFNA